MTEWGSTTQFQRLVATEESEGYRPAAAGIQVVNQPDDKQRARRSGRLGTCLGLLGEQRCGFHREITSQLDGLVL